MRIDFYLIETPNNISFSDLLRDARPDNEHRVQNVNDRTVRLQQIHRREDGLWECEMIRIRMDEVPIVAGLDGHLAVVDLEDDEGIGEESCFLYDERTGVMVIQRNRFGVSASVVARFFEQVGALPEPVVPTVILERDAIAMLSRMQDVRRFTVRFAGVRNPKLLTQHKPSTASAIQLIGDFKVPSIEIKISMGRQRGAFPLRDVLRQAKQFMQRDDVEKLRAYGKWDDGNPREIDIFSYAMVEEETVAPDANRNLPYTDRIAALRAAFNRRKDELQDLYPTQGS